jgi:hypothetical protein
MVHVPLAGVAWHLCVHITSTNSLTCSMSKSFLNVYQHHNDKLKQLINRYLLSVLDDA